MKEGGRSGWTMDNLNRAEKNAWTEGGEVESLPNNYCPPLSSIKFVSWGQRKWREGEGVGWLVGWFVECRKKPGLEIAIFPFS